MYKGKRVKRGVSRKKPALLVASLALLLSVSVMGTLAFLVAKSGTVTNTFTLEKVPNEVVEDITSEPGTKNDVAIKNKGTADAYIRAAVVATWAKTDANGNVLGYSGIAPVFGKDYTWCASNDSGAEGTYNTTDWTFREDDGFYYYKGKVGAGESTEILFTKCSVLNGANVPEGYVLSVEIMGQSIQADGVDADGTPVELAWGIEAARLVGAVDAESSEGGEG